MWAPNGITVAGSHRYGNRRKQLFFPYGLFVDVDQTVIVADWGNHRIVEWKSGAKKGQVVAGGNGQGDRDDQLNYPSDVIVDRQTDSLIICDSSNNRVVRWPRRGGKSGETIISNISCCGLTMDDEGSLYVSDRKNHEVRRWRVGETEGTLVAGGNGQGQRLDQLNSPDDICVDRDHSVFVSDYGNHRVMKWMKDANEGIVVAGGEGQGNALTQLSYPEGLAIDQLGTVYVSDSWNHRIMRWCQGAKQGDVILDGNVNQLDRPMGLSFDGDGNLYVVDFLDYRVQKYLVTTHVTILRPKRRFYCGCTAFKTR